MNGLHILSPSGLDGVPIPAANKRLLLVVDLVGHQAWSTSAPASGRDHCDSPDGVAPLLLRLVDGCIPAMSAVLPPYDRDATEIARDCRPVARDACSSVLPLDLSMSAGGTSRQQDTIGRDPVSRRATPDSVTSATFSESVAYKKSVLRRYCE